MTVLYDHYSLTSLWKGYFLVPLLFEKSERDTGLTKWLCTPGNRSTETAGRIWADNKVPSATFSAAADSKDEEDLVKVLDAEDPLAALASGWRIDGKKQAITSQSRQEFSCIDYSIRSPVCGRKIKSLAWYVYNFMVTWPNLSTVK